LTEPILIRDARPEDWPTIAEFNAALAWETEGKRLSRPVLDAGVQRALADTNKGRYFIAEGAGHVVGQTLVTYEWSDWRDGWLWWIQSVYVTPAARGQGVYRRLHGHIRDQALRSGQVRGLRLYVENANTRAQTTYQALGMVDSGYRLFEEDWSAATDRSSGPP
jgi:GNAT superfamily N-acetyltransferase